MIHTFITQGSRGVVVERVYSGSFMTSLQMAGVSVTVLLLTDDIIAYLGMISINPNTIAVPKPK